MKIGILTYHFANNYGAVLQAYALKSHLENQGHTAEILNYNSSLLYRKNRGLKAKTLSFVWGGVKWFIGGRKKKAAFDLFRKNYLKTDKNQIKVPENLKAYTDNGNFDAFIVGSDQVWNPVLNGRDSNYYLAFAENSLKISYAASFGVSAVCDKDYALIKDNVSQLNAISVREQTGCKILKACDVQKNATVVLDPVFLLSAQEWKKLSSDRAIKEKYILCYVMPGDKSLENKISATAEALREKYGYRIIYIGRKEYFRFKNDGKDMVGASPEDFLSLIANAEILVTNSFHGTAFALIFQKEFYSLKNSNLSGEKQLGSRIQELLSLTGLENRLLGPESNDITNEKIDYSSVSEKIKMKLSESKDFLTKALTNR